MKHSKSALSVIRHFALCAMMMFAMTSAHAQKTGLPGTGLPGTGLPGSPSPEYDRNLMRLAEILGALHYLRKLCGANDGQVWRQRMIKLRDAENLPPGKRTKLNRSFNLGFRGHKRSFLKCNPKASSAIDRFIREGVKLSLSMAQTRQNQTKKTSPDDVTQPKSEN